MRNAPDHLQLRVPASKNALTHCGWIHLKWLLIAWKEKIIFRSNSISRDSLPVFFCFLGCCHEVIPTDVDLSVLWIVSIQTDVKLCPLLLKPRMQLESADDSQMTDTYYEYVMHTHINWNLLFFSSFIGDTFFTVQSFRDRFLLWWAFHHMSVTPHFIFREQT